MNTKNRWSLAIFVSVLFHMIIFLVITLFRPAAPVVKKMPAEIFIAEQQPTAAANTLDTPAPDSAADTSTSIINKTAPAKKRPPTNQQNNKTAPTTPTPKPLLPIPPQYNISSLSGQDLAKALPLNPIPPKPITTPKSLQLPDNLPPDTTHLSTTILFIVTADGTVKAKVEKTSGDKDFDNAALRTIYKWRFEKMNADFPIPSEQVFTWPISH